MVVEEHLAGIMSQATILIDHPEHGFRPGRNLGVLNVKARIADAMQHPSVHDTVVQPFRRCNIMGGELQIGKVQRGCQATAKVSLRVVSAWSRKTWGSPTKIKFGIAITPHKKRLPGNMLESSAPGLANSWATRPWVPLERHVAAVQALFNVESLSSTRARAQTSSLASWAIEA